MKKHHYPLDQKKKAMEVLEGLNGNLRKASKALDIPQTTLFNWRKYGIKSRRSDLLSAEDETKIAVMLENNVPRAEIAKRFNLVDTMPYVIYKRVKGIPFSKRENVVKAKSPSPTVEPKPTSPKNITETLEDLPVFLQSQLEEIKRQLEQARATVKSLEIKERQCRRAIAALNSDRPERSLLSLRR